LQRFGRKTGARILDLCCGSGCMGITALLELPHAQCVFADISDAALHVCRSNISRHGLREQSQIIALDAMEEPDGSLGLFDLILCNPPYISSDEMLALPVSVSGFEPNEALYGGSDGLNFYRAISRNFRKCLRPGGILCYEIGAYQRFDVSQILEQNGFSDICAIQDYAENDRAVSAVYLKKQI